MTSGMDGLFVYAYFRRFIGVFPNAEASIDNPLVLNKLSVYAT